jgi:amidohydrolase
MKKTLAVLGLTIATASQADIAWETIDEAAAAVQPQVVEWRRWFHQNPELGNREFQTAERVAGILRDMGLEPRTGIAHTGVVALIEGGKPGPLVAIRADMDALPVSEQTGLPFASEARSEYNGQEVGVMHACGHDSHMAMALGAAKLLHDMRDELAGSVLVIFQPAEEGAPAGEQGGASMMLDQGLFDEQAPEAIFGLHVGIIRTPGTFGTKPGPLMAAADRWTMTVHGKQTHGARPWDGIDPIVVASQIVLGFQSIVSRQVDVTQAPSIISVGRINGGIRNNVIPDQVELEGTIRSFDPEMRSYIHAAMARTARGIAESAGATVEFEVAGDGTPPLINDDALAEMMAPVLQRIAGEVPLVKVNPQTVAEDFAEFSERVPGLYAFIGTFPEGADPATAPTNHSPMFNIHEADMQLGVRAFAHMVVTYLQSE